MYISPKNECIQKRLWWHWIRINSKNNLIVNHYTIKSVWTLDNKIPREGYQFICLSVILIDSVFRTGKKYYPQVFLEEYVVKEKKIPKYIIVNIEVSLDSEKKILMKKILIKKFWWRLLKIFFIIFSITKNGK